jgi:hypothetical protein
VDNGRKNGRANLAKLIDKDPNHQKKAAARAVKVNKEKGTAVYAPGISSEGGKAAHQQKDANGKSIHAKRLGSITSSQLWEDPNHPELGHHNSGNLVRKQKAMGLPHGKENRVKVKNESDKWT